MQAVPPLTRSVFSPTRHATSIDRRALLAASTLSLLLLPRCEATAAKMSTAADVPSDIKALVDNVLKVGFCHTITSHKTCAR